MSRLITLSDTELDLVSGGNYGGRTTTNSHNTTNSFDGNVIRSFGSGGNGGDVLIGGGNGATTLGGTNGAVTITTSGGAGTFTSGNGAVTVS
jgi:hypothetical protein